MELEELVKELTKHNEELVNAKVQYKDHDGYLNNINEVYWDSEDSVLILTAGD